MSASDLSRDRAPGNCGGLTGRLVAYRRSAPAFVLMGVCLAGVAFAASSARAEAVVRLGGRIEATDAGFARTLPVDRKKTPSRSVVDPRFTPEGYS